MHDLDHLLRTVPSLGAYSGHYQSSTDADHGRIHAMDPLPENAIPYEITRPHCANRQTGGTSREDTYTRMRRGRHQIGFGIAKNVLQVHGVDAQGRCGVQRQLKRPQGIPYFSQLPHCPIGMEACAGAHFRARKLTALGRIRRFAVAQYSRVRSSDAATKCAFRPAKSTNTPTCVKETSPHETLRSLLPV
jgi:hypothetical protein